MKKIALFASGSGTNVENINNFFKNDKDVSVSLILTNNKNAFVVERAKKLKIPYIIFNKDDFYKKNVVLDSLIKEKIDLVVLAGFLWLVPRNIIINFSQKIINIHPALLPKFGGKGMFGMNVHNAVYDAKESETGITIHYVNEHYDEGNVIFQTKFRIEKNDTPETIAQKIHKLEYEHFPKVIKKLL